MNLDKPISKPIILALFGFIVIGYFISQLNTYYEKTEIENHKIEVIGNVIDQYYTGKLLRYIRYEYTFEGVTYEDTEPLGDKSGNFLNKYFKVKISERKPEFCIILLDEEIILP